MPKKRKSTKKPKESNIGSSSLLPARSSGEKPDIPFRIKTEIEDNDVPESQKTAVDEIYSFIEGYKNCAVIPQDTECSNHSVSSTATELMETDESIANSSETSKEESQTSFSQVSVKTEPTEISHNQENFASPTVQTSHILAPSPSGVQGFSSNNHVDNCDKNVPFVHNHMLPQNVSIKSEPVESIQDATKNIQNAIKLQNDVNHKKTATKRKPNFETALDLIRSQTEIKKIKMEPDVDNENQSVEVKVNIPQIENSTIQIKKESSDEECCIEMEKDTDISIVPVVKKEKKAIIITLSDDEDETQQNSNWQDVNMEVNQNLSSIPLQSSASTSHPKPAEERIFSKEILKYFNIVSELDRYDCQEALTILEKDKTNNTLENFFPTVKKERKKKPHEIKKGDILFKQETSLPSETECVPISSNVGCNAPEAASQHVNFPTPAVEPVLQHDSFASLPTHQILTPPKPVLHRDNFPSPPMHQLPTPPAHQLPQPSNSEINFFLNPKIPDLISIINQNKKEIQEIIDRTQHITMPSTNIATTHLPEIPLQDSCFRKVSTLQNGSTIQGSNVVNNHFPSPSLCFNNSLKPTIPYPLAQLSNQSTERATELNSLYPVSVETSFNHSFQTLSESSSYSDPPQVLSTPLPYPSVPTTRDPRLSYRQTPKFPPRKGTKELLLYHNIGKDIITQHFMTLVLQWNPCWVQIQMDSGECPPICDSYTNVIYFYRHEMAYYNTYVPLHMLHIWCNIVDCWKPGKAKVIQDVNCTVQSVVYKDNFFRICVNAELDQTAVWPKRDDIMFGKCKNEEAFLLVEDVRQRNIIGETRHKLKMTLLTLHDFKLQTNDDMKVSILLNMRIACMEVEALNSLDSSMKELVLKPDIYRESIEIVKLDQGKNIKLQRNDILQAMELDKVRAVVVETYPVCDIIVLITQVSYMLIKAQLQDKNIKKQNKVLIICKNDEYVSKLFKRLSGYNPVLAVRTKQIQLPEEYVKFTMEYRLGRKETVNDIVNNHHIFITAFSAFSSSERSHLLKLKRLTCIVDDANMCTEVETALPLTLKIHKLLLIGNKDRNFKDSLNSKLLLHRYHVSLFMRFLKAKQNC